MVFETTVETYQHFIEMKKMMKISSEWCLHFSVQIDGLVQEKCNSSALAMVLGLSCTNPLKCSYNSHNLPIDMICTLSNQFYMDTYGLFTHSH